MNSRILSILAIITSVVALCCTTTHAAIPQTISYQGYLTTPSGAAINNPSVSMVFKLYDAVTGGNVLHTETQTVAVSNGIFNVVLGTTTALTASFTGPYWLSVAVGGDAEMSPRQPLTASPYALRAANADSLAAIATVTGSQFTGAISTATLPGTGLTGTISTAQIANASVTAAKLASNGCTGGQVLQYNGSAWVCATPKAKNTRVVSAIGGDFTTISAALTSITDNTASNRYVIYVGPGTYTEQVTMKPYVVIQGAGESATKITFTGFPSSNSGTVLGASNAKLRFLTVECIGGANAIAVYNNGVSPRLNHVTVIASGGGGNFGIFNQTNAAPTISNSTLTSAGTALTNNGSGNSLRISNSQLSGVLPYLLINGTASTLNIATSQLSGGGGIFNTGTLACVFS